MLSQDVRFSKILKYIYISISALHIKSLCFSSLLHIPFISTPNNSLTIMSVVLAKTDSEVSSLTPSSPTRSPSSRRPVYYVQSPSRDSHDGEKTTNSFHSSPVLSPMGSPPHSHSNSSLGPHSRDSSSTRFSASVKPGSRKPANHKIPKPWKRFDAIEEERLLDDDGSSDGFTRRCYFLAFVISFVLLFSLFSLILWGASRPQKPTILMKVKLPIFIIHIKINLEKKK